MFYKSASETNSHTHTTQIFYFYFYRYLITAPKLLRLDASEKVVVQLFGYDQEITVFLHLKNTLAAGSKEYASQSVKLNAANDYQASATLRVGLHI